jgi:putative hydrolase of the HAD superfamily
MQAILFDLDNTLYSAEHALFDLIDVRINRYMHQVVGIAADQVDILRRRYWQQYGVTLQGLMDEHGADPEDYLAYVHDIDVSSRLGVNAELRGMLDELPQRKFVFTNGSRAHALQVLNCLQIADCFEHIFDIQLSGYIPKPNRIPYAALLKTTGLDGENCVMVEDSLVNLDMAAQLGMKTILVRPENMSNPSFTEHVDPKSVRIDAVVTSVEQVGSVVQGWGAQS